METENEYYDVSETAVKDHSMLGAHGEELCNNLDVHWMTQTCGSPKDETRKCVCRCVCVCVCVRCVCECVLCVTFTRKGTPSERSLSIGSIGLQYSFILQAVSRIPETRSFFVSGFAHVRNFRNVSRQQSPYPDIYGFPSTAQTFVADNWTYGTFLVLQKNKS